MPSPFRRKHNCKCIRLYSFRYFQSHYFNYLQNKMLKKICIASNHRINIYLFIYLFIYSYWDWAQLKVITPELAIIKTVWQCFFFIYSELIWTTYYGLQHVRSYLHTSVCALSESCYYFRELVSEPTQTAAWILVFWQMKSY